MILFPILSHSSNEIRIFWPITNGLKGKREIFLKEI